MRVERIGLHWVRLPLKQPFESSLERMQSRDSILLWVEAGSVRGYGECVALTTPFYTEETTATAWVMLEQFLIPMLLGAKVTTPAQVEELYRPVRRNRMAIAALEGAVWDLFSKTRGQSLSTALGGTRTEIEVGVSVGLQKSVHAMLDSIGQFLQQGYRRVKVKIKPGMDLQVLTAIRERFGMELALIADANSAYRLQDLAHLQALDGLNLLMLEQPLGHDDLFEHAHLQKHLRTAICLDESIHSLNDVQRAIELGSCRAVCIKPGRVGGLSQAKAIHDLCVAKSISMYCGGMLELGVGRAHNIALASLPGFEIAGDTSASSRSYAQDIVIPAIDFCRPGHLAVPSLPGIGYTVDADALARFSIRQAEFAAAL